MYYYPQFIFQETEAGSFACSFPESLLTTLRPLLDDAWPFIAYITGEEA